MGGGTRAEERWAGTTSYRVIGGLHLGATQSQQTSGHKEVIWVRFPFEYMPGSRVENGLQEASQTSLFHDKKKYWPPHRSSDFLRFTELLSYEPVHQFHAQGPLPTPSWWHSHTWGVDSTQQSHKHSHGLTLVEKGVWKPSSSDGSHSLL